MGFIFCTGRTRTAGESPGSEPTAAGGEGRNDLATLVAYAQCQGSQYHLDQESFRSYFPMEAALDHVHAGAHIIGSTQQQVDSCDQSAHQENAQVGIGKPLLSILGRFMEHGTEQRADQST